MSDEFINDFEFNGGFDDDFDPITGPDTISKKKLLIVFLVDTSGSMAGTKIGTLNTTMEEVLPLLSGVGGATTDIELAVLKFSDGCEWVSPNPIPVDTYQYWSALKADGLTDLGEAFKELSSKLSRSEFLSSASLSYAPVLFLLTDGYATDDAYSGLRVLKGNSWYKYGLKIALGIGSSFDEKLLEEFTGNKELVVTAKTSEQLARLVKEIAVTSSQIGSKSISLTGGEDGEELTYDQVRGSKEKELGEHIEQIMNDDEFVESFDIDDEFQ